MNKTTYEFTNYLDIPMIAELSEEFSADNSNLKITIYDARHKGKFGWANGQHISTYYYNDFYNNQKIIKRIGLEMQDDNKELVLSPGDLHEINDYFETVLPSLQKYINKQGA